MRVIVAGSRGFTDESYIENTLDLLDILDSFDKAPTLVCGMCPNSPDMTAHDIWTDLGYPIAEYPADWEQHGRSAGFIRNRQMAHNADILVAFWDGASPGTCDMIHRAIETGLELHVYRIAKEE